MGWTTVCIKQKRNKTPNFIIKTEKKTHQPTNTFLSDCKSVYKCTACGCVRDCVIGEVYQHLNYCKEIFQIRALTKHTLGGFLFPLRFFYSRTWHSTSPLATLTCFCERPFHVKAHWCPGQMVRFFCLHKISTASHKQNHVHLTHSSVTAVPTNKT